MADGWKEIAQGYEMGLSPADLYGPYNKLYAEIRRFIDPDYFGLLRWSDEDEEFVPMHVNPRGNPFEDRDHRGKRVRRRFKKSDLLCHCFAEPRDGRPRFAFLVNSPNTSTHLLCLDIDGKDCAVTHRIAADLYLDLFADHLVYTERSRNRRGCYVWVLVERASDPATFNALCNALTVTLRRRYHDLGDVDDRAYEARCGERVNFFDGIKATLHYDDRDALTRLYADADGNPNDNHRGLLATMPLSGFLRDREGEHQKDVFLRFVKRRNGRYGNAIPEQHLWRILSRLNPRKEAELRRLERICVTEQEGGGEGERSDPAPPAATRPPRTRLHDAGARQRSLTRARSESTGKNRMSFASSLFFYEHMRYADTPAELVAYYEAMNLHTGEDRYGRRLQRAEEALARHRATPVKPKSAFHLEEWVPVVRRYVTDRVRTHPTIKYKYPVEDEMIAAALALLTFNAFKPNRSDRMHTTDQTAQEAWYKALNDAGVVSFRYSMKQKRVDVVKLLQLSGLIVLRNSQFRYGGRERGYGMAFGLGVNHPRHAEFVRLYGHVVDAKSLPLLNDVVKGDAA